MVILVASTAGTSAALWEETDLWSAVEVAAGEIGGHLTTASHHPPKHLGGLMERADSQGKASSLFFFSFTEGRKKKDKVSHIFLQYTLQGALFLCNPAVFCTTLNPGTDIIDIILSFQRASLRFTSHERNPFPSNETIPCLPEIRKNPWVQWQLCSTLAAPQTLILGTATTEETTHRALHLLNHPNSSRRTMPNPKSLPGFRIGLNLEFEHLWSLEELSSRSFTPPLSKVS